MSKIRRFKCAFLVASFTLSLGVLVSSVQAQSAVMAQSSGDFPDDTAPNTIHWELRTASNQAVVWEYTFPTINSVAQWSQSKHAFPETAASLGIDWAAWSAAVVDPAYNRWLVTRNGMTIELPWPGVTAGVTPSFVLDELRITIGKTATSGHGNLFVSGAAFDNPVVPEPASWLLLVMCSVVHFRTRRSRGNTVVR